MERMDLFEPLFESWDQIVQELIDGQRTRLLVQARKIVPFATSDDILQPNDFPLLEHNPDFRYEEGILAGLLSAQIALRAHIRAIH